MRGRDHVIPILDSNGDPDFMFLDDSGGVWRYNDEGVIVRDRTANRTRSVYRSALEPYDL